MSNLKNLRTRIRSVKSTQKITSAMKVVAGAKLHSAQERVEAIRPYENLMYGMVKGLLNNQHDIEEKSLLMTGHVNNPTHLLVVVTTDRGLCGGLNSNVVRAAKACVSRLQADGREVKILCWGRKGRELLRYSHGELIIETLLHDHHTQKQGFEIALDFTKRLQSMLEGNVYGSASIVFSVFHSVLRQEAVHHSLIPFNDIDEERKSLPIKKNALYEYEPDPDTLLAHLLPRYLAVQIYKVLLENSASEYGARMTAMDNATRNADEMIQNLGREYNRTRQADITKELIEIISAAEAM